MNLEQKNRWKRTFANISKETRKLWRLQTSEKYKINKLSETSFEVFSEDLMFRAFVDPMGIIIYAKDDKNYSKAAFYKLKNYCVLLQKSHWDIN